MLICYLIYILTKKLINKISKQNLTIAFFLLQFFMGGCLCLFYRYSLYYSGCPLFMITDVKLYKNFFNNILLLQKTNKITINGCLILLDIFLLLDQILFGIFAAFITNVFYIYYLFKIMQYIKNKKN